MRRLIRAIRKLMNHLGFFPGKGWQFISGIPSFFKEYHQLKKQLGQNSDFKLGRFFPIFFDKKATNGEARGAYFHQDMVVAQQIYKNNPTRHIDIGSRIDGFIAHLAIFREVEVFDIRPQPATIKNITFIQADLMDWDPALENACDSLSSLHAIEHFGLGRYSDPIDAEGHLKAFKHIYQMLEKGGKFYFSGPIGPLRIEFNAHRVWSISYLLTLFNNKYRIDRFSYVNDDGLLFEDVEMKEEAIRHNFGCTLGCGIFEMTKI